jgi:hypothetical protein
MADAPVLFDNARRLNLFRYRINRAPISCGLHRLFREVGQLFLSVDDFF